MKKILLLLMITLSMLSVNAQNDETSEAVKTVYNDGKEATKTVYNDLKTLGPKIESAIGEIAKGLKIGAENVWQILVKQQQVWSITFLILTLTSLINWYIFYRRNIVKKSDIEWTVLQRDIIGDIINPQYDSYYADKASYKNDIRVQKTIKGSVGKEQYNAPKDINLIEKTNGDILIKWLHFTTCISLSILSIYYFRDMLTGFINPEFGALKTLFTTAQTLK